MSFPRYKPFGDALKRCMELGCGHSPVGDGQPVRWTSSQLALRIGSKKNSVDSFRMGRRRPRADTFRRLTEALKDDCRAVPLVPAAPHQREQAEVSHLKSAQAEAWVGLQHAYYADPLFDPLSRDGASEQIEGDGLKLFLAQDDESAKYANPSYATAYIHYPSQLAEVGTGLPIWFFASFPPTTEKQLVLKSAQFEIDVPTGFDPSPLLGQGTPHLCPSGIEIHFQGRVRRTHRWRLSRPNGDALLGHNAEAEGPPLLALYRPKPGDRLPFRLFVYANSDFQLGKSQMGKDSGNPDLGDGVANAMRERIIDRLRLKEIGDPSNDGRIWLVITYNFVEEVK